MWLSEHKHSAMASAIRDLGSYIPIECIWLFPVCSGYTLQHGWFQERGIPSLPYVNPSQGPFQGQKTVCVREMQHEGDSPLPWRWWVGPGGWECGWPLGTPAQHQDGNLSPTATASWFHQQPELNQKKVLPRVPEWGVTCACQRPLPGGGGGLCLDSWIPDQQNCERIYHP